ncbi:hypothetical protein MHYP_G00258630 [Metynnis hypsauchen]
MDDHDYGLAALLGASDNGDSEVADIEIDKQADKINQVHTPLKSSHPKKYKKGNKNLHSDGIGETILLVVNSLTKKMDTQTELLRKFEKRIEENTVAIIENKENTELLRKKVIERLQDTVNIVHRLGKKSDPTTSNNAPRSIIIQFVARTVGDDVWKRSRDARVCQEKHIQFKEDFSKEDREARKKLWPLVQDARPRGQRSFLKDGYVLFNN